MRLSQSLSRVSQISVAPGLMALGETVKIAVAWCCAQAVTRHAMPPMVAGAFTSGLLAAMTGQAATELAMKYNFKKPPPELVFATGVYSRSRDSR